MKYVFMGASPSIVRWAYSDVIKSDKIEYCDLDWKTIRKYKYFLTRKAGKLMPFLIKDIVYSRITGHAFLQEASLKREDILIIFTSQYNMLCESGFSFFVQYLKRKFKKAKFVFYYNDIIETCNPESLAIIKDLFDLVLTFDRRDAEKYDIEYYGEVYSQCVIESVDSSIKPFDFFFVGGDRGRYDEIMAAFHCLADWNTVFYLYDVCDEHKDNLRDAFGKAEGIVQYKNSLLYIDTYCPYPKTLSYIEHCKCIVEVLLPEQRGGTMRLPESVTYAKKLLTNCKLAKDKPYYRENNIHIIDDSFKNITKEEIAYFMDMPLIPVKYDFSPLRMIEYAETKLFEE